MFANVIGSCVHFGLAPYLANSLGLKFYGVAISSTVQFLVRGLIQVSMSYCDPDLRKCLVSIKDERVWDKEGFSEVNQ